MKKQCIKSISHALKHGYTHIDTATDYNNEKNVGKAIKEAKIKREEIFITTKLSGDIKDVENATICFEKSLKNLQTDYIDLYMIHSPIPWDESDDADYDQENVLLWQLMEKWYKEGKVRSIGVSNFALSDLENIINNCEIVPHANQICYYIGCVQKEVVDFCKKNQIQVVGHSPLAHGELLKNQEIIKIAQKYDKSVSQICIAFALQNDILPLPKSVKEKNIALNVAVDFTIANDDMHYLMSLVDTIKDAKEDYLC